MSRKKYVNRFVLVVALLSVAGAAPHAAAQGPTVTLTLVNTEQQPVPGARVVLFITSWGDSDEYDLPVRGHFVHLDFPALIAKVGAVKRDATGFIYIKAAGYAPLMSQPFQWPFGPAATIDFRDGRTIRANAGVSPTWSSSITIAWLPSTSASTASGHDG